MDIKEKVKRLPLGCGVYIMRSKEGKVLYVGKASSLRKRVHSYFLKNVSLKTGFLMEKVADIDYIECNSQEQALVLEAALIKEEKPKYNIVLRDDKSYPYIEITADGFPRVFIARKKTNKSSRYFGPYPQVSVLKSVLNLMRKIFPYCSCVSFKSRQCLFSHLNLCPAPCAGRITKAEYKENIRNIIKILKGEREELIKNLRKSMQEFSNKNRFEEAGDLRDKIVSLENLYKGRVLTHELLSLKESLSLSSIPLRIEAIDISSLSGKQATGSVVVFQNGIACKALYRRYRIKEVIVTDDYAMMAEVVRRRYSRLLNENSKMPDLIVVDGGPGHVQVAKCELDKLKLKIAIIGIAKRNEEIWLPERHRPLVLSKDSAALHLIQRLRDEAHRFARKYHFLLRKKKIVEYSTSYVSRRT